jgi:hypothetical protein
MSGDATELRAALEAARVRGDELRRRLEDTRQLLQDWRAGARPSSRCWSRRRSWHIFLACLALVIAAGLPALIIHLRIRDAELWHSSISESMPEVDRQLAKLEGAAPRVKRELAALRQWDPRQYKDDELELPHDQAESLEAMAGFRKDLQWRRVGLAACRVKQRALAREAYEALQRLTRAQAAKRKTSTSVLGAVVEGELKASLQALTGACGDLLGAEAAGPASAPASP